MADPFAVLGLRHPCTEADVKKAYRQLALQYHPDKAGPSGLEAMKQINAAFEIINEGKLGLSEKQHTAPEPSQEPETQHKPKPRREEGSSSTSGNGSKLRAEEKQWSPYKSESNSWEQKHQKPRPYAESSERTYFHPKYGSFTPGGSRQAYQKNDESRFSNANNQQRADDKTETGSSGLGPYPFDGPHQQYPEDDGIE